MDTSGFNNTEDFLSDDTFLQYCLGTDPAAVAYWQQWVSDHPEQKATVDKARELYFFLNGGIAQTQFEQDRDRFQQQFKQHTDAPRLYTVPDSPVRSKRRTRRRVYTAIVLSVAIAAVALLWKSPFSHSGKASVYHTKAGEKRKLQLPDGSTILLNGNSTVSITPDFNKRNRNVYLSGEGYFEVAHNAQQPFMVHTPAILIKVLGTVFNVKAYPGDAIIETSLLQGSIQVYVNKRSGGTALPENGLLLLPNQKLRVMNAIAKALPVPGNALAAKNYQVIPLANDTALNTLVETDWTRGRLTFNDQPFDAIVLELERWYNVKIRFENQQLKQYRFVATFDKENIDQVLQALQATTNFNYRKEQDTIILY